jgi:hypothetical protein
MSTKIIKQTLALILLGSIVIFLPNCEKQCMPSTIGGFCFVNETQQKIKMQGSTYEWFSNSKVLYPQEKIYAGTGTRVLDCNKKDGLSVSPYHPENDMCGWVKIIFNDTIEIIYNRADTIGRSPFNLDNYVTKDSLYYYYYFTEEDYQNALQQYQR